MNKEEVLTKIANLKNSQFGSVSLKCKFCDLSYELILLTRDKKDDEELISLISRWRRENQFWFSAIFNVTDEGTKKWYLSGLIDVPDRLLFIIRVAGEYIGHVGLFRFDFDNKSCEIDNIMRGERKYPGVIGNAIENLQKWGKQELGIGKYLLQTFSINEKALKLYKKIGYKELGRDPLICVERLDRIEWISSSEKSDNPVYRYNVRMELIE
mgnify:CR=1 FL=1